MSVSDVSGKAIANLATEELKHPAPVFHGDTLFCESEVLEKRESQSKPDRGTVRVHTRVLNQDGVLVAEFKRLVLVPRRNPGTACQQRLRLRCRGRHLAARPAGLSPAVRIRASDGPSLNGTPGGPAIGFVERPWMGDFLFRRTASIRAAAPESAGAR